MTYLVCNKEIIYNNTYKLVNNRNGGSTSCVTNRKAMSKGRWYFEVKYVSGTGKDFLAVFVGDRSNNFGIYPFRRGLNSLFLYSWSGSNELSFSINEENYSMIDLNTSDFSIGDTFGIGFDMYSKMMYVRFKNDIRHILVKTTIKFYQPHFYEGVVQEIKEDTIKVSFEPSEFVYTIPKGYSPWGYKTRETCIQRRCTNTQNTVLIIIALCC